MELLATVGIILVFLGVLGPFLDKYHFEESTIDRVRLWLVAFFVFLDDLPKRSGPIVGWLDSIHERRSFNIRTGEYVEEQGNWKAWTIRLLQVAFAIAFPVVNETYFYGPGWGLSIVGGILLAYMAPLLVFLCIGFWTILAGLLVLFILAVIEVIRRFLLIVLNKSTSPRTSPFTYLVALI